MQTRCKQLFTILFALFALTPCLLNVHAVVAQTNDAGANLLVANNAVEQAFNAVLEAEKAGANVTNLLVRLNGVADILAKDEMSYRNGNESAATTNLNIVVSVASDVKSEAINAEDSAKAVADGAFWTSAAVFIIGGVAFLLTLFLVWLRFKAKPHLELVTSEVEIRVFRD